MWATLGLLGLLACALVFGAWIIARTAYTDTCPAEDTEATS